MSEPTVVDLQLMHGDDKTCVWESDDIQVMRVRLAVDEKLPTHNCNANLLMLPLEGKVRLVTPAGEAVFGPGEAMRVPYDTQMDVSNGGDGPATFLITKTPHPKTFS